MPETLITMIALIGIVVVGVAFIAIDVVKDVGRVILMALATMLVIFFLGQIFRPADSPESYNNPSYNPNSSDSYNSNPNNFTTRSAPNLDTSDPYNSGSYNSGSYNPDYNSPDYNSPNSPNPSSTATNALDNFTRNLSRLLNEGLKQLDAFVYGGNDATGQNPTSVDPSQLGQPNTSVVPPEDSVEPPAEAPAESPEVPSRVSRITNQESGGQSTVRADNYSGAVQNSGAAAGTNSTRQPVSGWW